LAASPPGPPASIHLIVLPTEPFTASTAILEVRDAENDPVVVSFGAVTWSSSDTTIATVVDGLVSGVKPGDATITATFRGITGSTIMHIAWRPETRLKIAQGPILAEIGDRLVFTPYATGELAASKLDWESSRPDIARLDAPGVFTALAVGTTTIIGRAAGLVDSVHVNVEASNQVGFGYFYSTDAGDPEGYADTYWIPPYGKGYSTAGTVSATWVPPYASQPDLGWVGPSRAALGAVFHVVSLDNSNCTAYPQPSGSYQFVMLGAPLVDCHDKAGTLGSQSPRMEFVAFQAAEFSGRMVLVRADGSLLSTGNASIRALSPGSATGDYAVDGIGRDSVYWFASPGASNLAACATAPTSSLSAPTSVRVTCVGARNAPADPRAYLVGFGPDVRRAAQPIGFIEIGADAKIARKTVNGLDLSVTGVDPSNLLLTVSGDQVAASDRIPAVLVSAIEPNPNGCSLHEFGRTATTVQFQIVCPDATGATVGVIY
jgi:hypothetical protein